MSCPPKVLGPAPPSAAAAAAPDNDDDAIAFCSLISPGAYYSREHSSAFGYKDITALLSVCLRL